MTLPAFADFLYGSCLIDWNSMHKRISRHAQLLDEAEEVRIVGNETDLRLSVAGRRAEVDAGTGNMPGGEFFVCPVETSAEGTIAFTEFPAIARRTRDRGICPKAGGPSPCRSSATKKKPTPTTAPSTRAASSNCRGTS